MKEAFELSVDTATTRWISATKLPIVAWPEQIPFHCSGPARSIKYELHFYGAKTRNVLTNFTVLQ